MKKSILLLLAIGLQACNSSSNVIVEKQSEGDFNFIGSKTTIVAMPYKANSRIKILSEGCRIAFYEGVPWVDSVFNQEVEVRDFYISLDLPKDIVENIEGDVAKVLYVILSERTKPKPRKRLIIKNKRGIQMITGDDHCFKYI
jgi:hypothetical protein